MICRNCKTEHYGKFCPNCGTPASDDSTQPGMSRLPDNSNQPKKPITKRWWFWAIAVILFLALISNLSENDNKQQASASMVSQKTESKEIVPAAKNATTPEPTSVPTPTSTPTPSPEPTIDLSTVATEYELTAGNYVAGVDIPSGKCEVVAISGQGNLSSSNMFSGGINEMFGVDDGTGFYTSEFKGLKLPEDTTLTVSGSAKIRLIYSTIESSFTGRSYDETKAFELSTGNYEAGVDFEAGVYNIVAVSGTGNLSTDNMFDGGLNEMFGKDDGYGFYTEEFKNVDLPNGTELSVSGGVKIKLIPASMN